jgi:hypothetical protein
MTAHGGSDPGELHRRPTERVGVSAFRRVDAAATPAEKELAPQRAGPPIVDLDPRFDKLLHDFEAGFPVGSPSLIACARLTVVGDVAFGRGVVVRGSVTIEHRGPGQRRIAEGAVLEG